MGVIARLGPVLRWPRRRRAIEPLCPHEEQVLEILRARRAAAEEARRKEQTDG